MALPDSGSIFYKDDYDTLYEVTWETAQLDGSDVLDFTTVVKQPYVWGEDDQGHIQNRVVYRRGICTTTRQIFAPTVTGYEVLAEGTSQIICVFPTTFSGEEVPEDNFLHHLDSMVSDFFEHEITCGPRFSDPDDTDSNAIVFSEVTAGGAISHISGKQTFQFVDNWSQSDNIYDFDCEEVVYDISGPIFPDFTGAYEYAGDVNGEPYYEWTGGGVYLALIVSPLTAWQIGPTPGTFATNGWLGGIGAGIVGDYTAIGSTSGTATVSEI